MREAALEVSCVPQDVDRRKGAAATRRKTVTIPRIRVTRTVNIAAVVGMLTLDAKQRMCGVRLGQSG
jgi:hypothetical protein